MKYYKNSENKAEIADKPEHEVLVPAGYTEITEAEYDTLQALTILKESAQVALTKSDITILRCYENAVSVPASWHTYRDDLRAIVSGTSAVTELPTRPDYPSGT